MEVVVTHEENGDLRAGFLRRVGVGLCVSSVGYLDCDEPSFICPVIAEICSNGEL